MKGSNSLSDDELKEYAEEHLQYEVDMLVWSAGILARLASLKNEGHLPWSINNGLLNSFSAHARNLIAFLYSRPMGKEFSTDIVIEDFVDEEIVNKHLVEIDPLLEEAIKKANKQVAHLTMERIEYEESGKAWRFIEVAQAILKAFASITPYMPSARISDTLRSKLCGGQFIIPLIDVEIRHDDSGFPLGVSLNLRKATPPE